MAATWSELLDGDLVGISVGCDDKGVGTISAYALWPEGARHSPTMQFKKVLDELWACLDSLVEESVEMFSVQRRRRRPECPRFLPVADSDKGLQALLEESFVDGILVDHYRLIRACQPHLAPGPDVHVQHLRNRVRQLQIWTEELENGRSVGAWLTIGDPEVLVDPPTVVTSLVAAPPGELNDERIVAHFTLVDYNRKSQLQCEADSYVDLASTDAR